MTDLSWFPFSILATLLFGVMMALYKLPSANNYSKFATAFWSFFTAGIFSLIFFSSYISLTSGGMIMVAVLWGATYASTTLLQMHALKHVDTNAVFPVTATGSLIATISVGIFFFKEYISLLQILGVILAITIIYLFVYKGKKIQYTPLVMWIGLGIVVSGTLNKTIHKITADNFDIHAFQIYQYAFAALFALMLCLFFHRGELKKHIFSKSMRAGCLIGTFSFLGGYSWLIALTKGPFSLVVAIHSFYIFITAIVGYLLFKEELSRRKIILLFLAIVAIIIIRLG